MKVIIVFYEKAKESKNFMHFDALCSANLPQIGEDKATGIWSYKGRRGHLIAAQNLEECNISSWLEHKTRPWCLEKSSTTWLASLLVMNPMVQSVKKKTTI